MTAITHRASRRAVAAGAAGILALGLAACAPSGDTIDEDAVSDALETETTLTVWGWDPGFEPIAEAFEDKYPAITVNVVNAGTGADHYTKLQNAIAAGTGAPDVAQMEYQAIPQFAISGGLYDLQQAGIDSIKDKYTEAAWTSVQVGDGTYGLPLGTGPMALFYNKAVFDEYDLTVPTTWDEYLETARALKKADPDAYITNDAGDAGFTTSLIWQAGGRPFSSDGENVTIDLADAGSTTFADTWQAALDEELVAPISSWSDQWYQGLGDGSIATLVIGAWMAGNLESGVPDAAGDWRVAPMPAFEDGSTVTAENGGGGVSVVEQSKNKEVATAFVEFMTTEAQPIELEVVGGIPSTVADLENEEWLNTEWDYFGGQQINQIFAESATSVGAGWQYLPYQVYANSIYGDTVGQAYLGDVTLAEGLKAWQDQLVSYGNEQGFSVNK